MRLILKNIIDIGDFRVIFELGDNFIFFIVLMGIFVMFCIVFFIYYYI